MPKPRRTRSRRASAQKSGAAVSSTINARLIRLQKALGVDADGMLGPETLTALEQRILPDTPRKRQGSLQVSTAGLDLIVQFEVSSRAAYEKNFRKPTWPGGASGVTIGVGYDIGYVTREQFLADWRGRLPDIAVERLLISRGVTGDSARTLCRTLADVEVPFDTAATVFYQSTLPRFAADTRATYAGVERLPADAQAMLLSLVFNRGSSLKGDRRSHMRALQPLIARPRADLDAIAGQFDLMVELWPTVPGLQKRRQREAATIRAADRDYSTQELIAI